jgi:spore coat protein CotH
MTTLTAAAAPRPRRVRAILPTVLVLALAACTTPEAPVEAADVAVEDKSLFDSTQVHTVDIAVDEAEVAAMIEEYEASGEKMWITCTVTIDGTTLEDVGLRLKGNSSLRTMSLDSSPSTLPWLVRLDKYVDGQSYGEVTSFVVRSNSTRTGLNEAVALELIELAGLASQQATSVALSVNSADPTLRVVIENPDEAWEESAFDSPGVLYKSEAQGDWSYRGEDPQSYVDAFDQETGEEDLTPLIEFLDFVNNSDDATFAAELAEHLDVNEFARYLAIQELVDNFDDISGPGNNSYLRYDSETGLFTVVPWDQNLSFGQTPAMGGGPGGAGDPGNGGGAQGDQPAMPQGEPGRVPEGCDPSQLTDGSEPTQTPDGSDPSQVPEACDPSRLLEGCDPSQTLDGCDLSCPHCPRGSTSARCSAARGWAATSWRNASERCRSSSRSTRPPSSTCAPSWLTAAPPSRCSRTGSPC